MDLGLAVESIVVSLLQCDLAALLEGLFIVENEEVGMSKDKRIRFRLDQQAKDLLVLLSEKHQYSKSEMMEKLIGEKAKEELAYIKPVVGMEE